MKHALKFILLFVLSIESLACVCSGPESFHNKKDLSEYNYVALVHIDSTFLSGNNPEGRPRFYEAAITSIIQFKGEQSDRLLIAGGLTGLTDWWTSCDIGVRTGEKWIIFSKKNEYNKPMAWRCGFTIEYEKANGQKNWFPKSGVQRLEQLKLVYDKGDYPKSGVRETYYSSGQIEKSETFKRGKLNGIRKVYYPTGELLLTERYKNGRLHGNLKWYLKDGTVVRDFNYKKGKPFGRCITYYEWSGEKEFEINYSKKGQQLIWSRYG